MRAMGDKPKQGRWTAEIEGDFVVFIIGAKPNSPRMIRFLKDLGGSKGMKHMLDYLMEHPEKGLLGYHTYALGAVTIQYWRSFDHLDAFAKNTDDPHLNVWRKYLKRVGKSDRTGIWHETFLVKADSFETIYSNMPPMGLGKASKLIPLGEAKSARERFRANVT
jgi:Domain of unknown function (DUF4188)